MVIYLLSKLAIKIQQALLKCLVMLQLKNYCKQRNSRHARWVWVEIHFEVAFLSWSTSVFKTYYFNLHACGSQCRKFLLVRNTKKESLAVCWQRFSYLCTYLNLLGLQNVKYLNSMMSLWVTSNLAHLIQNFFFLKKPSWGLNFFIFFLVK